MEKNIEIRNNRLAIVADQFADRQTHVTYSAHEGIYG